MKKLFLILSVILLAAPAMAQTCLMGVAWTPDSVGPAAITEQQVWHDTDGVDGGDTLAGTVSATANVFQWSLASACYTADRVYVTTVYNGGLTVTSPKVAVQNVVGAILTNSVKHQE